MKQIKQKEFSEECPTKCEICKEYYNDGSCLKKVGKVLRKMCKECFKKSTEELNEIIHENLNYT